MSLKHRAAGLFPTVCFIAGAGVFFLGLLGQQVFGRPPVLLGLFFVSVGLAAER